MLHFEREFDRDFPAVVDRIYEAATGDTSWPLALEKVCDFVGARAADVTFFDPAAEQVTRFYPARTDDFVLRYVSDYMSDLRNNNPRMPPLLRTGQDELFADSDIWSPKELAAMPFFAELIRPWGTFESLNAWVRKGDGRQPWVALLMHFGKAAGIPQQAVRDRLGLLLPHLRRAFGTEERLHAVQWEASVLRETLDQVAEPVALLDSTGRIKHANAAARAILERDASLSLSHDERMVLSDSEARSAFSKALAQCASPILLLSKRRVPPPGQIAVRRIDGQPLILTLQPLSKQFTAGSGAVAILFISDLDRKPKDASATLRLAYGLSPVEARLVQGLGDGLLLKEFAAQNHMTYETARSYLRSIFAKTGTRNQADLMRIRRSMR